MSPKLKLFTAGLVLVVAGQSCQCFKTQGEIDSERFTNQMQQDALLRMQAEADAARTSANANTNTNANVQTYTAPAKPPRDQQTQKVNNIQCPGAELKAEKDGGTLINVVKLKDGKCYWAAQFHLGKPEAGRCEAWHLHDGQVTALDGSKATDPLPGEDNCGFGKLNTVQEGLISISTTQFDRLYD